MVDIDIICLYNIIMKIITKYSCFELTIEIYHDYFILNNTIENQSQSTHVLFSHISFLQLHNYDNSSSRLSSIEFIMKNDIKLKYLPNNKIYFSSTKECSFVFNALFTAYRTYQNKR